MARASAIACGYEDAIDLDRLRHDPLMKVAVGRCPASGAPLASQSTISRLENAPSKTEAAQRFPYEPRVVRGKLMMPAELQAIHRYVVGTPVLENVTEEVRAVIETVWPELMSKLPPKA